MTKHGAHMIAEEAAKYLHMSESHFSHIATRLSRVKVGRRWLYPRSEINKALTNKTI